MNGFLGFPGRGESLLALIERGRELLRRSERTQPADAAGGFAQEHAHN